VSKVHASSQPTVYSILDRLDQMHVFAKNSLHQEHSLKETIEKKEREIVALRQDLVSLKSEHDEAHKELVLMSQKLIKKKNKARFLQKRKRSLRSRLVRCRV